MRTVVPSHELAGDPNGPAALVSEALNLWQPQACSLTRSPGREEGLDASRQGDRVHAVAAVADTEDDALAFWKFAGVRDLVAHDVLARNDADGAAFGHRLARVEAQVHEGQFELGGVGLDRRQFIGQVVLERRPWTG